MPLVFIRHIGANLAYVQALDAVDPGFGVGGGVDPGYGHPAWGGHPDQGLPGMGGYPSHGLPGSPGHPDNRPPASAPPAIAAGQTLVLVRDPVGVWHYATIDASTPPPKPVPVPPPLYPSTGPIPGQPPLPGQPLPPTAAPKA